MTSPSRHSACHDLLAGVLLWSDGKRPESCQHLVRPRTVPTIKGYAARNVNRALIEKPSPHPVLRQDQNYPGTQSCLCTLGTPISYTQREASRLLDLPDAQSPAQVTCTLGTSLSPGHLSSVRPKHTHCHRRETDERSNISGFSTIFLL